MWSECASSSSDKKKQKTQAARHRREINCEFACVNKHACVCVWELFHTHLHMCVLWLCLNFIFASVCKRRPESGGDSCTLTLGGCKVFLLQPCISDESTEQENELLPIPLSLKSSSLAQITEGEEEGKRNIYAWVRRVGSALNCTRHANHLHHVQHWGTHLMQRSSRVIVAAHVNSRCGQFTEKNHFCFKTLTIYKEERERDSFINNNSWMSKFEHKIITKNWFYLFRSRYINHPLNVCCPLTMLPISSHIFEP